MSSSRLKRGFLAVLLAVSPLLQAANYTIGTGSQSGTYYPLGGMLARVWSENIDDVNMRAEVTAASVENIIKVVAGQQLVGIAMGDSVLAAVRGEAPFRKPLDVAVLFALYPNVVQIVVPADSSIQSVSDLRGKKVSVGAPGSGTRVGAMAVLAALGIDETAFRAQSLDFTATTEALANGQIDAGIIVASSGVGAITELALSREVRILSFSKAELDAVNTAQPAYRPINVSEKTYHRVPAFRAPAVWNVLVVRRDLAPDLATKMIVSGYANMGKIAQVIADARYASVANMARLRGAPLHPSAEAYRRASLSP